MVGVGVVGIDSDRFVQEGVVTNHVRDIHLVTKDLVSTSTRIHACRLQSLIGCQRARHLLSLPLRPYMSCRYQATRWKGAAARTQA